MPLHRNPEIMVTRMEDEVVLLNPSNREIFTLNKTGVIVWDHIERGTDQIVIAVCDAFNVDPDGAKRDVEELVEELSSRGLAREP